MAKIIIKPKVLEEAGILKVIMDNMVFDIEDPRNLTFLMLRDYANGKLPEKYRYFRIDSIEAIAIDIADSDAVESIKHLWCSSE